MDINTSPSTPSDSLPTWRGEWLGYLCLTMIVIFNWLPYSYYRMVAWGWIALWQAGFLLIVIWAIWMLRQFQIPFYRLGYGLDWTVGLIALSLILSTIFCQFKEVALWNISLAFCYPILLYVMRNWLAKGGLTLQRLWIGISILGVSTAIIGLITWFPELMTGATRNQYPLGHPNFVAGYILLVFPLTLALSLSSQGWQRIGGLFACLLLGITLYSTSSRGGFLGLLVLGFVGMAFFIVQGQKKQKLYRLLGCILLLVILLLILVNNPRVQQIIKINSSNENSQIVQLNVDGESQDRLFMLKAAANIVKDKPFFGVGPGNMSRVYNLYRSLEAGIGAAHVQQLHNTPVQLLGELGIFGLVTGGFFLGCLIKLWYLLYQKISDQKERYLLYGIGGGLLAYGVASFTDYQLENIGISSTLVFLIVLLIGLADAHNLSQNQPLKILLRRFFSLGSITALVLVIITWLPVTLATKITAQSIQDFHNNKFEEGYQEISKAANLIPWNPVYNLLAGFQLLSLRDIVQDKTSFNQLNQELLKHFQKALDAAPYDSFFNQNLGILYRDANETDKAIFYLSRCLQLLPRNSDYTYYLLGQEYLKQKQTKKALTAFGLQGLLQPEFLTSPSWNKPPLSSLKEPALQETFILFSSLLDKLSSNNPFYPQVYENFVLLKWWNQQPVTNLETKFLTPLTQALLLAEKSPQSALEILNKAIPLTSQPDGLLLLRAWLAPQQYLNSYLEAKLNPGLETQDKQLIQQSIQQKRNLRYWLIDITKNLNYSQREGLLLTYRNPYAEKVSYILLPKELEVNFMVLSLKLFPTYSRVFPVLDNFVNQIKTEELNLPSPLIP